MSARPAEGVIVVTRFECPGLWKLLVLVFLHRRMAREVRRHATGFLGSSLLVGWRTRTLLNVSLWRDMDGVHSMGRVRRHVDATRVPSRLGVATSGGIYSFTGDWKQVMFGIDSEGVSPVRPL
ncbi:hypothetical protein AB0C21_36305 [Spirillospora sp. NPDC049024]